MVVSEGGEVALDEVLEVEAVVGSVAGRAARQGGEVVQQAEEVVLGEAVGEVGAVRLGLDTQLLRGDTQAIRHQ